MKRLIAATTGFIVPLVIGGQALAQTIGIDPCPQQSGGFTGLCNLEANSTGKLVGQIVQLLFVIAVIIAIFFLIWGGIKWIMSTGDKAKVESARNTIIAGIIGLILVFLAFFIVQVVTNLFGISITNLQLPNFIE